MSTITHEGNGRMATKHEADTPLAEIKSFHGGVIELAEVHERGRIAIAIDADKLPALTKAATVGTTADRLKSFVARIERLESEKQGIADDIKEVYGEAAGEGFDVKVLRKLIALRKQDPEAVAEQAEILELYMSAIGE